MSTTAFSRTVLVGGTGLFASLDQGESWTLAGGGLPPTRCRSMAFGPAGSGLLYATSDAFSYATFYRSTDMGATWRPIDSATRPKSLMTISAHPTNDKIVFGVTRTEGLFRSTDQGDNWTLLDGGIPTTGAQYAAVTSSGTVYAAFYTGFFRSTDNGDSWTPRGNGMASSNVVDLAWDPLDALHLFAANSDAGVYESRDGGDNWNLIYNEPGLDAVGVTAGGQRLYAGKEFSFGSGGKFYRSTDGGSTWTHLNDHAARSIAVSESDPMAVACGGGIEGHVFVSLDGGDTWGFRPIDQHGPPPGVTVYELAIPPAGSDAYLYAASWEGIQRLVAK